jgi:aurora kinase
MTKIAINDCKNRFLPITESVAKGLEPEPKISDFTILKELGSGSFGRVYLVTHKKTKVQYAIKAIDKRNKTNQEEKPYFRREVEVMYKIHHPNVVKLYGHFEDKNYCYFLMEYISKGNIYGLIPQDKKKRLNAQVVASLMKGVISAVYFLHNMNPPIIHRDIKPENVLLSEKMEAKLTDFGWSNYMEEDQKRTTVCGTPIYLAPEIIKEKGHDEKVDIWCIGVLLFELITGSVPFQGNDIDTLKNNILKLKISWPRDINTDAKNLISKILKLDPYARLPLSDMLQHPFFTKYCPNAPQSLIKPDQTIKYKPFVISVDDPKTWDPIDKDSEKTKDKGETSKEEKVGEKTPKKEKFSKEKYKSLKEKYENLEKECYKLKNGKTDDNDIEKLKAILKEKEERVAQLIGLAKEKGQEADNANESYLKMKVDELEKENQSLKDKVLRYESFIKSEQGNGIENNLRELRESMTNKDSFNLAVDKLRSKLSEDAAKSLNEIIKEKEKEIMKIKEVEKTRREKENKKYNAVINKFDKSLNNAERENNELKAKLKALLAGVNK